MTGGTPGSKKRASCDYGKGCELKKRHQTKPHVSTENADDLPSASADLVHRVIEHPSQTESNRRAPTQMSRTFESLSVMMHLS